MRTREVSPRYSNQTGWTLYLPRVCSPRNWTNMNTWSGWRRGRWQVDSAVFEGMFLRDLGLIFRVLLWARYVSICVNLMPGKRSSSRLRKRWCFYKLPRAAEYCLVPKYGWTALYDLDRASRSRHNHLVTSYQSHEEAWIWSEPRWWVCHAFNRVGLSFHRNNGPCRLHVCSGDQEYVPSVPPKPEPPCPGQQSWRQKAEWGALEYIDWQRKINFVVRVISAFRYRRAVCLSW